MTCTFSSKISSLPAPPHPISHGNSINMAMHTLNMFSYLVHQNHKCFHGNHMNPNIRTNRNLATNETRICMCVRGCIYACVRIYGCIHACVCVWLYICMRVCVVVYMYACMYVSVCACMYTKMHGILHTRACTCT